MRTYNQPLADTVAAIVILVMGMFAAKPILNWLMIKLYDLFIGKHHI